MVSIIMPSYNTAEYISKSIESVLRQTFVDWELIIVDDASSDQSAVLIEAYCQQHARIKFLKLIENSGVAVARNKALELAQGRYIAFLDSDDLWLPRKLETQLREMKKHDWPFSFTAYDQIDEEDNILGHIGVPSKISYRGLLKTNLIGCLSVIYDTRYFGKVPMPLLRKRQDFGLWLTLLKKTPYGHGLSDTLGQYRVRRQSISSNKKKAALYNWKLYREVERLSVVASCWYFANYAVRGILRAKFPNLARKLKVLN